MPRDSFRTSIGVFRLPNWTLKFPLNSVRQSIFRSVAEVSFRETTRRLRLETYLSHHECQHFLCRNVVDHWRSFIKDNRISALQFANAWRNHLRGCNSMRSRSLYFQIRKPGDIYSEVHSARINNFPKTLRQRNQRFYDHSFDERPGCLSRLRTELPPTGWRSSRVGILYETSPIFHTAWRLRDGSLHQGPKWQFGGLWKDWFSNRLTRRRLGMAQRTRLTQNVSQELPSHLNHFNHIYISFCSSLGSTRFSLSEVLFCGTRIKIEQWSERI